MEVLTCAKGHPAPSPYSTQCVEGHDLVDGNFTSPVVEPLPGAAVPPPGPEEPVDGGPPGRAEDGPELVTRVVVGSVIVDVSQRSFHLGRRFSVAPPSVAHALATYVGVDGDHAEVSVDGDNVILIPNPTTNGTYLNGQILTPGEARPVAPGDLLRLGQSCLIRIQPRQERAEGRIGPITRPLDDQIPATEVEGEISGLLPRVPTAWDDVTPTIQLHDGATTRLTQCQRRDGSLVVVKAYMPVGTDPAPLWSRWQELVDRGAPLVPLERVLIENGVAFEQMPYRVRRSLAETMTLGGDWPRQPLGETELSAVVRRLSAALEALHTPDADGLVVIHRDINPSNILVTSQDPFEVELGDPHVALRCESTGVVPPYVGGNPYYAAPEDAARVGIELDYYNLGMTLAELGTGLHPYQNPFDGRFIAPDTLAIQRLSREPVVVDGLSPETRTLIHGLLMRSFNERFGAAEVRSWLDGTPIERPWSEPMPDRSSGPRDNSTPSGRAEPGDPPAVPPDARPFLVFDGVPRYSVLEIAEGFNHDRGWERTAAYALGDTTNGRLLSALDAMNPAAAARVRAVLSDYGQASVSPHRVLVRLVTALDPNSPAMFRGQLVDLPSLARLVEDALTGDPQATLLVRQLADSGAMADLAERPELAGYAAVATHYGRLASMASVLQRQQVPNDARPNPGDFHDALVPRLLGSVLSSDAQAALAREADDVRARVGGRVAWINALARPEDGPDGAAYDAVLVAATLGLPPEPVVVPSPELTQWAREYLERPRPDVVRTPPRRRTHRSHEESSQPLPMGRLAMSVAFLLLLGAHLWAVGNPYAVSVPAVAIPTTVVLMFWSARSRLELVRAVAGRTAAATAVATAIALAGVFFGRAATATSVAWVVWFVLVLLNPTVLTAATRLLRSAHARSHRRDRPPRRTSSPSRRRLAPRRGRAGTGGPRSRRRRRPDRDRSGGSELVRQRS